MTDYVHTNAFPAGHNSQRGAVLAVSLLILLVMTIIGIASMGSTTLQEKMANNNAQRQIALQAAEVALRAGETFLLANINSVTDLATNFNATNPVDGLYSQRAPLVGVATRPVTSMSAFIDDDWLASGNSVAVTTMNNLSRQPRYVIEYMGRVGEPPKTSYTNKKPDTRQYAFRITAIGWGEGTAPTARYILQSSFRTPLL
ncbi:MAG: PilX N-terminal domain-containing pilus assembly protein [Thiogranum sp.]